LSDRDDSVGDGGFAALLQRARSGDAGALDAILASHLPGLRAYVRLNASPALRAKESCSDLMQSVCREALQDLADLRSDAEPAFRQWLFTLALRKIQDRAKFYRAERRDAGREVGPPAGTDAERELLATYRTFASPSHHAAAREEVARLEAAFDRLPPEYRDVIVQARLLGLSHAEIARQQDRSEEAVRMLLHRARAKLARLLD